MTDPAPAPAQPEVVIEDPRIDRDRMMYADLDYEAEPQFRIGEVTKFFFGRSDHWLRWLQKVEEGEERENKAGKKVRRKVKPNYLVLDGKEVGTRKTATGVRIFGLRDVEEIVYALGQQGRIDGEQMRHALVALDTVGKIWKVR